MTGRSRAALFLIEKLIVIAVFALCASACAGIFVEAFITSGDARDLNHALVAAKNGAERYKAYGDAQRTAQSLGGRVYGAYGENVAVYYDDNWRVSGEDGAAFVMSLRSIDGEPQFIRELSVDKVTGEEIISFTIAAKRERAQPPATDN